jgi:hypothetical protein
VTHWPVFLIILIFFAIPLGLESIEYIERENLKWKIWLISLPIFCALWFIEFFCGNNSSNFDLSNILGWLGLTLGTWLLLILVVFFGSAGKYAPPWEKHPSEVDDDLNNLFDSAMAICKEKREGKNTSKKEAEYKRQLNDFEENG